MGVCLENGEVWGAQRALLGVRSEIHGIPEHTEPYTHSNGGGLCPPVLAPGGMLSHAPHT